MVAQLQLELIHANAAMKALDDIYKGNLETAQREQATMPDSDGGDDDGGGGAAAASDRKRARAESLTFRLAL